MSENSSNTVHFQEYFKVIRSRIWVIFTIFILTVLSGAYVTEEVIAKVYSATADIEIKARNMPSVADFGGDTPDRIIDPNSFQNEFQIMQEPDTLLPIIEDLGLEKRWAKTVFKSSTGTLTAQEALAHMTQILKFDFTRGTNIIKITASSEDPKEAAEIANALANRYKTMREVEEAERNNRGTSSIRDQIDQQQKIVDAQQAKVDQLRQAAQSAGFPIQPGSRGSESQLDQDLIRRKSDLLTAKEDADARRVLLQSVINLSDEEFINTLEALGRQEPDIANLRSQTFSLESDVDDLLKKGFGEDNPEVQSVRAEIAVKQQQIKDLVAGTRRAMTVDSQMADSRVALLAGEVKDLTSKTLAEQSSQLEPFQDAQSELEKQQSLLDAYNVHLKQVSADFHMVESPVQIVAKALPPEAPSKPNKTLDMGVSVMAGLFVGVVVAFLIEYLDTSVKTMADAESLLGLPVLTVIPNKGGPMPLTQQAARLPHAEGYRILRAKLDLKVQNVLSRCWICPSCNTHSLHRCILSRNENGSRSCIGYGGFRWHLI